MKQKFKPMIFEGPFKDICPKFIEYKQSLGFKYDYRVQQALRALDIFFKENGITQISITKEIAQKYTAKRNNEASRTQAARQSLIRQLGLYLKQQGYEEIYIYPEKDMISITTSFVPHIYTNDEMENIFSIVDNLKYNPRQPYGYIIYPMLIRMLFSCGLRLTEALSLKHEDVDLINGIIHVNKGKNNISRLVPMSSSLLKYSVNYAKKINFKNTIYFFPAPDGEMYNRHGVGSRFQSFLRQANIPRNSGGLGPRLHDLRHTFAVYALEQMIRQGQDIYCALPILSVYLGHKGIESTEKYLRLTTEHLKDIVTATESVYQGIFPEVTHNEE